MKILVVGANNFGQKHLSGIKDMEISIVERKPEVIEKTLEKFKIENVYSNFEDAIKDRFDIVDLVVPHYLHKEMAIKAMEAGSNVLVEKPIASTLDYGMLKAEEEKLSAAGLGPVVGNVFTSDALMTHNKEFAQKLAKDGNIAVELEGAGLYFIAKLRGVKALSVHLAYGNLVTGEQLPADKISENEKKISETLLELLTQ